MLTMSMIMRANRLALVALMASTLAACGGNGEQPGDVPTFAGIAPDENITALGNEPFWNAKIEGATLTYSTPENIGGTAITVERFAGNGGLGISGMLEGQPLQLAITPGECSDTMSDRSYPYVATLTIGDDLREGCAFTDSQPFTGGEAP